jgi:hypothetical protein
MVALSEPDVLLTVNHDLLLLIFQPRFEAISNIAVLFADAATFNLVVETVKDAPDACVTIIVCDVTPLPEMVTVAVRELKVGLANAVTVIVAMPEPVVSFTFNHV